MNGPGGTRTSGDQLMPPKRPTTRTEGKAGPTIISKNASNWVDRGEPPHPTLRRVLAHFFERRAPEDQAWLNEQAEIVLGMVAADATEIHIAGYLRSLVRETG